MLPFSPFIDEWSSLDGDGPSRWCSTTRVSLRVWPHRLPLRLLALWGVGGGHGRNGGGRGGRRRGGGGRGCGRGGGRGEEGGEERGLAIGLHHGNRFSIGPHDVHTLLRHGVTILHSRYTRKVVILILNCAHKHTQASKIQNTPAKARQVSSTAISTYHKGYHKQLHWQMSRIYKIAVTRSSNVTRRSHLVYW